MLPTESGYYQDGDDVGYVTQGGTTYHVQGPANPEPVWQRVEEFSEDAERVENQAEYQEYQRSREAYGIDPMRFIVRRATPGAASGSNGRFMLAKLKKLSKGQKYIYLRVTEDLRQVLDSNALPISVGVAMPTTTWVGMPPAPPVWRTEAYNATVGPERRQSLFQARSVHSREAVWAGPRNRPIVDEETSQPSRASRGIDR